MGRQTEGNITGLGGREVNRGQNKRKRSSEKEKIKESDEISNLIPYSSSYSETLVNEVNTKGNDNSDDTHKEIKLELKVKNNKNLIQNIMEKNNKIESTEFPESDPIYRIMHALPRSDFLEIVKCRFGHVECERAAFYFDNSYMKNPLRHLRLQIGCDRLTGFHHFFQKIHYHRGNLRLLDLSRNDLDQDDVATLIELLNLNNNSKSDKEKTVLEVLDLSYNRRIGNSGAIFLLNSLRNNIKIRAVILKGISIDDNGAIGIASLLHQRPKPQIIDDDDEIINFQESTLKRCYTFFLNLNENRIGAIGTTALGKKLPVHVSLTVCKQRPLRNVKRVNVE